MPQLIRFVEKLIGRITIVNTTDGFVHELLGSLLRGNGIGAVKQGCRSFARQDRRPTRQPAGVRKFL